MIEKVYASHIKTRLDIAAINGMRGPNRKGPSRPHVAGERASDELANASLEDEIHQRCGRGEMGDAADSIGTGRTTRLTPERCAARQTARGARCAFWEGTKVLKPLYATVLSGTRKHASPPDRTGACWSAPPGACFLSRKAASDVEVRKAVPGRSRRMADQMTKLGGSVEARPTLACVSQ